MTPSTPTLITIKILAHTAPVAKDVQSALTEFGSVVQYEATHLVFDGNSLVPAPTPTVGLPKPKEVSPVPKNKEVARKAQAAQAVSRAEAKRSKSDDKPKKPINLEPGSNPEIIYRLVHEGPALTSTQIREKLGLNSNVVNTTVYRLKNAGMIRPMSYNAPNGDTLYTSTGLDPKTEVVDEQE